MLSRPAAVAFSIWPSRFMSWSSPKVRITQLRIQRQATTPSGSRSGEARPITKARPDDDFADYSLAPCRSRCRLAELAGCKHDHPGSGAFGLPHGPILNQSAAQEHVPKDNTPAPFHCVELAGESIARLLSRSWGRQSLRHLQQHRTLTSPEGAKSLSGSRSPLFDDLGLKMPGAAIAGAIHSRPPRQNSIRN